MEVINDMKPFIHKTIFQILKGLVMSEAKLSNFDHANFKSKIQNLPRHQF